MVFLLSIYFFSLLLFGFINNVLGFCLLLVFNSFCCLLLICSISGFSWYALLLYVVYIGGVYILFIFVSVYLPNSLNVVTISFQSVVLIFFLVWEIVNNFLYFSLVTEEYSFNLCNSLEGNSYLLLCFFLVLSFFLVSYIGGSKEGFIR